MGTLSLDHIRNALAGNAAAFRSVTEYQPVGGPGDKIFPPTYEGGSYATELRHMGGEEVPCVLLDSVQSQANRMELALLEEWESGRAPLPVISADFTNAGLPKPFRVTSLEAPHRIADALLRDSELDGVMFRQSDTGKRLDTLDARNATALFELCPTALVFGMWDSTGPRGGLGVKFQRCMVSEITGFHAVQGRKTSSRIDPAQILRDAGPVYRTGDGSWTLPSRGGGGQQQRAAALGHQPRQHSALHHRRRLHHQPGAADHRAVPARAAPAALPHRPSRAGPPGGPGGPYRPGRHPDQGTGSGPPVPLPTLSHGARGLGTAGGSPC